MGNLGSLRVHTCPEPTPRPAGLPGRLRSLFSVGGWARKPEPRVRYGQTLLPGLAGLCDEPLDDVRGLLERAEAVRRRRFTYLGQTVGFASRIEWDRRDLPEAWRVALNSLDDLVTLGVAAALAQGTEARHGWYNAASGLLREWITGAPAGRGVAWELPALARRIPNLVYTYTCFAPELRGDPRQRHVFLESLYAQSEALAGALPGQPADRCLVEAARALFMAGRFFDGMEARGWLETGAGILWGQLREQVQDDGGHQSRNPAEHARVLASYLDVLALLRANNDDVPIWARKRIKGMADFLARLLHPDGEIPLFHDAGTGVEWSARQLLAVAAVVLHEPGLALPGELPGLWPLLVLGESGRRVHAVLPRRGQAAEARALRRTGFYVLPGDPGDVMIVDGAGPSPDGDANTFGYELSVGGARLVVDSGVGSTEAAPWPAYFRSTRAHNVVSVGGAEQLGAGRPPVVSDVHWVVRDGLLYFGGTHDGFARLSLDLRLRHRRHVLCLPGRFWLVCDEVLGLGEWEAESFVHFHPEVRIGAACRGRGSFTATRSAASSVRLVPAGAREARIVQGVDGPEPQGWYAPAPGQRRAAPVLSLIASGRAPFVFGYALLPRADAPAELSLQHDAFRLHAQLRTGGVEYLLTVVQGDVEMRTRTP